MAHCAPLRTSRRRQYCGSVNAFIAAAASVISSVGLDYRRSVGRFWAPHGPWLHQWSWRDGTWPPIATLLSGGPGIAGPPPSRRWPSLATWGIYFHEQGIVFRSAGGCPFPPGAPPRPAPPVSTTPPDIKEPPFY